MTEQVEERAPGTTQFSDLELARLKELAATSKKWWRNYPLLVSILAFLLSLTTSAISIYNAHQKDIHDQRAELGAALKTLQEITVQQIDIHLKHSGTPEEAAKTNLLKNQAYNTTLLASDLALKLGSYATTATLLPLSQRLYGYSQLTKAEETALLAITVAKSVEDEVGALKWLAFIKIHRRTPHAADDANALYTRALHAYKNYDLVSPSDPVIKWLKASTLLEWANNLAPLNCGEARRHFADAIKFLVSLPPNPDSNLMRTNVQRELQAGIGNIPSCMPTPGTSVNTFNSSPNP